MNDLIYDENDSVRQMALGSVEKMITDPKVLLEIVKKYSNDKN